ncbi:MAG: DUF177 domain-containing protein [Bacteroidetes bacterium]|nr:DUF177 domain-containing protein [Bacteroidota bacterium]MBU1114625.1 DUF177 domain-containing protein [Bacteroidota bacterium]MBU1797805.1 DUF177 domain-containing protein [Bacteroidota bacterium]
MQIKFNNYKNGVHQFVFENNVEELNLQENFVGKILLNCKMDKSSTQIVLNCNLHIVAKQVCDRCMYEFESEFETDFKNIYFITQSKSSDEEDESGIYYLSPDDDKIDLTNDTIENAILTIPMKILCKEDCKGLCSVCGVNKNETDCNCSINTGNSVWEPLLKLKGKLN